jgi:hypothetical protein
MSMLYADEKDSISALGKGGYVEYDAVAQEWGMGRADQADWNVLMKAKRRLSRIKTVLVPKLTSFQARDTFSPRIAKLEQIEAQIEAMTSNRDVRIGPTKERLITGFDGQTRDLKRDVRQQLNLQHRAVGSGERKQMRLERHASRALAKDARQAERYSRGMKRRGLGDEVDGRPITAPTLPPAAYDSYGGSQLVGVGANLWETLGLKSPISDDLAKGIPLSQIFAKWSHVLNVKSADIPRIPKGSTRSALEHTANQLKRQRDRLAGAFVTGARAGKEDEKALGSFAGGVKGFRSAVNAAIKKYGLRVLPEPPWTPGGMVVSLDEGGGTAKAGMLGLPWWMWLAGGAGLFLLAKKA